MSYNDFTLRVYDISGTLVPFPGFEQATGLRYETRYPAGLFGDATFFLPRRGFSPLQLIQPGYEVRLLDRGHVQYQGYVRGLEEITQDGQQGTLVTCLGAWDLYMERRGRERHWANDDLNIWKKQNQINGAELATFDRRQRLRITPKSETWTAGDVFRLVYDAPTGESFGRYEDNYDFVEGGAAWTFRMLQDASAFWAHTSSSTGSHAVNTSGAPTALNLDLVYTSGTPVSDGTMYGEVSSVMVYSARDSASATLGNVDVYEIALDIIDLLGVDETLISADQDGLDSSLTLDIKPFISNGWESYSNQLARAAGFGDSSQNAIGFFLSDPSLASDNRPKLVVETYPSLTGTPEYDITMEEGQVSIRVNGDDIYNYIIVDYDDEEDWRTRVTPDDDANLKNQTSIDQYGQREKFIDIGRGTATNAANYGRRFLARHQQPTYSITRPVVLSRIRSAKGPYVRAKYVRAGERIRIVDLQNPTSQAGALGTTFLITRTQYDHDSGMVSISLGGVPDSLAIYLAQLQKGLTVPQLAAGL